MVPPHDYRILTASFLDIPQLTTMTAVSFTIMLSLKE
jgi:hypothetical protein